MEEEKKIRRCVYCKKMLLDEKLPFCLRCRLAGRNKAGQWTAIAGTTLLTAFQIKNAVDSNGNPAEKV